MRSKLSKDPELSFSAVRSRGPGGQNVNKLSTSAQLKWNFQDSLLCTEDQKELIQQKLSNAINKAGILYIRCDEFRELEKNKSRCLDKLVDMLKYAYHRPKKRLATKPTKSSKIKRQNDKKERSKVKETRKKISY